MSLLALGIFVSFRLFQVPDITVDGSITLGAAIAAVLLVAGWHPLAAALLGMAGGMAAGAVTGTLQTRFDINPLLADRDGVVAVDARVAIAPADDANSCLI